MDLNVQEQALADAIVARNTAELHLSRPVDDYLVDSSSFSDWMEFDIPALLAKGVLQSVIDEFRTSISLGRKAEAAWLVRYFSLRSNSPEWKKQLKDAQALLKHFKDVARNAFGSGSALLREVTRLAGGNAHAEIVQGLANLAAFFRQHPVPLAAISFPADEIDRAETMAHDMLEQLAGIHTDRSVDAPERVFRDQVLMNIKLTSTRIRDAAPHALEGQPGRLKGYKAIKTSVRSSKSTSPKPKVIVPSTDDY